MIALGILLLIMSIPGSTAQTHNIVSIGDIVLDPGDSIMVPIMISNSTGVASVGIKLSYDPEIVIVTDVVQGDITGFFGLDDNSAENGWITINAFNIGTQMTGDVIIANVTFEAVGNTGDSPLDLEILAMSDKNASDISGQIKKGNIQIRSSASNDTIENIKSEILSSSSVETVPLDKKISGFGFFISAGCLLISSMLFLINKQ